MQAPRHSLAPLTVGNSLASLSVLERLSQAFVTSQQRHKGELAGLSGDGRLAALFP